MVSKKSRTEVRVKKHNRMRNHLAGTAQRPRLAEIGRASCRERV